MEKSDSTLKNNTCQTAQTCIDTKREEQCNAVEMYAKFPQSEMLPCIKLACCFSTGHTNQIYLLPAAVYSSQISHYYSSLKYYNVQTI